MEFKAIEASETYAVRVRVAVGEPLIRVLVIEKIQRNHQVKVRHLDGPHAGMEEFFPQRNFIASLEGGEGVPPRRAKNDRGVQPFR